MAPPPGRLSTSKKEPLGRRNPHDIGSSDSGGYGRGLEGAYRSFPLALAKGLFDDVGQVADLKKIKPGGKGNSPAFQHNQEEDIPEKPRNGAGHTKKASIPCIP
jgi:hypothetical protein